MDRNEIIENIARWIYGNHDTQYADAIIKQGLPMLSAGLAEDHAVLERDIAEAVGRLTTATA